MSQYRIFTSESVSNGHPDKIADQISDAIVDAIMTQDTHCRVACETLVKTGMVMIAGEITTKAWVDMEEIVRKTINNIGYNDLEMGFAGDSCAVLTAIGKQSPDIALGVDPHGEKELGAGDQGMMFGYASNETEVLMPAPITYSHRLMRRHADVRQHNHLLRPDGKCQLTFHYENDLPVRIDTVVFSTQHVPEVTQKEVQEVVMEDIIKPVIPEKWIDKSTRFLINPTGRFVIGGPQGDCGLTGRKIIVDSYGGLAHHGGGCFSGKDPSKVDRSGAYMARYVAKNIVAAGLADRCEIQVSYAIGVVNPTSIYIETFGTEKVAIDKIVKLVEQHFDFTPMGIIRTLQLLRPIYQLTAAFGHFGRLESEFIWENTDKASILREESGLKNPNGLKEQLFHG